MKSAPNSSNVLCLSLKFILLWLACIASITASRIPG